MAVFRKKRYYALVIIILIIIWYLSAEIIGRFMYPIHYKEAIIESAERYGVDPYWITAIIRVESNFRPNTVSSKGATGIMQIMPETARWIAKQASDFSESTPDLLTTPTLNIRMGTWYLRYLTAYFENLFDELGIVDERDRLAVIAASYNAGQGTVQNWLNSGRWDGKLAKSSKIPYDETRHYVQRVDYYYKKYKNLYNDLVDDNPKSPDS